MNADDIDSVNFNWVYKIIGHRNDILDTVSITSNKIVGGILFVIDGSKIDTIDLLYNKLSKDILLPSYFGRNFNAVEECLTDGDLMKGNRFTFLVVDGDNFLKNESSDTLQGFLETLEAVGAIWAKPSDWPWKRSAVPFKSFVQLEVDQKTGPYSTLSEISVAY